MKIIVPYYRQVHPVTWAVLRTYDFCPLLVEMHDDDDYRQLLHRLWREREPVIIVEHDIVPWPGAVEELWACPCKWGTYSYRINGGIGIAHALGCAKLTADLMDVVPSVWDEPAPWHTLDRKLFFAARERGLEPHLHRPPVIHLNERELRS